MNTNLKSFLIGGFITIFLIAAVILVAVFASRINQLEPVAPTVPQVKPHAEEPATTTAACTLTFTVAPTPAFTCDKITLSPDSQSIGSGGETRSLTVSTTNGAGALTYAWVTTGGTLSSTATKTVTWTAPASLNGSQKWNISVTVTDSTNKTATGDNCKVELGYNPGCNSSCLLDSNCPNDLSCVGGRCRKSACSSQSDCKCPPNPKVCNETCVKTEECGSGLICAGGNCRNSACINDSTCTCPPPPPILPTCNSICSTSADCPSNLGCVSGRCRNSACSNSTSCVCPVPTCNAVCTTSSDCPSNLGCTSGRCRNTVCPEMVGCVCKTPTHKECVGRACATVNGEGANTCTSDVSCAPVAIPPEIPKSGSPLVTVGVIFGGLALLAVGLLVAL